MSDCISQFPFVLLRCKSIYLIDAIKSLPFIKNENKNKNNLKL